MSEPDSPLLPGFSDTSSCVSHFKCKSTTKNLEIERALWEEGYTSIAGVDEVGRGPLAGPVVACACILPRDKVFRGVQDSKQLTAEERDELYYKLICDPEVVWSTASLDRETIDAMNILRASLLAMQKAVEGLSPQPDFVLLDGREKIPTLSIPHKAYIKGDNLSQSIAAASIIAKVIRDEAMDRYHEIWPEYGFNKHKGYATEEHIAALYEYGPCPIHRRSFSPVSELVSQEKELTFLVDIQ